MNAELNAQTLTINAVAEPFVRDLIKSIEKTYKLTLSLDEQVITEINRIYPITSGCWFADWLNHRLYTYIMTDCLENGLEVPPYTDWEELEKVEEEEEELVMLSCCPMCEKNPADKSIGGTDYCGGCFEDILNSETFPSYIEIVAKMEKFMADEDKPEYLRQSVMTWWAEFPERNYDRMLRVKKLLETIEPDWTDEDFDVPDWIKAEIKEIGDKINREGGKDTMVGCFYILINFMNPDKNKRLKALEVCWDGVGDWKY
jgi:hypothetical protein